LLQQSNKELTGDSTHTRSELIELEQTVRKYRGKGAWPSKDDSCSSAPTVLQAADAYKKFLSDCNLVDSWAVFETLGQILKRLSDDSAESAESSESDRLRLLVLNPLEEEEYERLAALGSLISAKKMDIPDGQARQERTTLEIFKLF
jgi:hypothetical protein